MVNLRATRLERPFLQWAFWILVGFSIAGLILALFVTHYLLLFLSATCLSFLLYSRFIEPEIITIKRFRLSLVAKPQAWLRIAFLSDFHAGGSKRKDFYRRMVQKTAAQKPDVIFLGGDFVDEDTSSISDLEPLAALTAKFGRYFILGNHDYLDDPHPIRRALETWGYRDLTNATEKIEKNGESLTLVALDDSWFGAPDVNMLRDVKDRPRLLFMHEPDGLLDVDAKDAEAIVLGHTHGGQVRLPVVGSVATLPQGVPQYLDRGRKTWKGIPVLISQGLGEMGLQVRLFCFPQIVMMEVGI